MDAGKVKCVIFDCDGTLIDSERCCLEALYNVFSRFSDNVSKTDLMAHFQGGKLADILTQTCERLEIHVSLDILEPLYREQMQKLLQSDLLPVDGVPEMLRELKKRGVAVCVVSNSPKRKMEFLLELTGLLGEFRGALFSAFDANSWKPDPDLLLYAAMNMGVLPQECLYIDDTPLGVEAGISANMRTYHFRANAYSPKVGLSAVEEISDIRQILNIVTDTETDTCLSASGYS
jgi:HAD superfamily hydrolase (TIGR01509 family)